MRRLTAALAGVLATGVATVVLEARAPGGAARWARTNYAGRPVTLLGGAAQATALALTGPLVARRTGAAAAVATLTAGAAGALDDLTESAADREVKGLSGHLGELRRGRVTTGALKIAGIGTGAVVAAVLLPVGPARPRALGGRLTDVATRAALIAGSANLLNLLDLRPGRALKSTGLLTLPVALAGGRGGSLAAGTLGVAAAGLRDDLGERTMLGDTGANALGAAVGTALAAGPSRPVRLGALGAVVALTLASERVSFSEVIERVPVLRTLDHLGWR